MKRIACILALLWGISLLVIVVVGLLPLATSYESGRANKTDPCALVDGREVYVVHRELKSMARAGRLEVWSRPRLEIVFSEYVRDGDIVSESKQAWTAFAIDEPYHVLFQRPDGSMTEPLEFQWLRNGSGAWVQEGKAMEFNSGSINYVGYPMTDLHSRRWDEAALRLFLGLMLTRHVTKWGSGTLLLAILLGGGIALWRHYLCIPPYLCANCRYDLRGCDVEGCPECGAGRHRPDDESKLEESVDE
ncbi:MAG: hypothetical protein O7G85_15215 [Planctomycetota bacterium]|nr:hypothetical protein [Planctomycetota bacterium]